MKLPRNKTRFYKRNWLYLLALTIALTLLMAGCQAVPASNTPPFPDADPQVGKELKMACWTQDTHQDLCPHLHAWLAKLHKLQQQLELQ